MAPRDLDGHWPAFAPSFFPQLDVSTAASVLDLAEAIERDFARKAPSAREIADRVAGGAYPSRFELLRDATRYLYWAHRYYLTLYTIRPCRWEDAPFGDRDARLPLVVTLDVARGLADLVAEALRGLPAAWPGTDEETVFSLLAEPLASVTYDPSLLSAKLATVGEAVEDPRSAVIRVPGPRPVVAPTERREILELCGEVPELTALLRQAGAIASEHVGRWGRPALTKITRLRGPDFVLLAWPRSTEVAELLRDGRPRRPVPATSWRSPRIGGGTAGLRYTPSRGVAIAGLAAVTGELRATNEDLVANAAWHWSAMSSNDIFERTGILERSYTERSLDELAGAAALEVLAQAEDIAETVGAVVACSATNTQLMPSLAARVADRAGLTQLAGVWDVVAACAGLPYGLAQAARIVEEAGCAVLLVLAEKFSDKLGTVRSSRMLFGDGAAAMLLCPAAGGESDVHHVRTYAGGTGGEVYAVRWPNGEFNNDVTVDGPGARSIVQRYMRQILDDLADAAGPGASPLDGIDLVVPHQANRRMVSEIAAAAGIPSERLYFNVARVGNLGCASIPVALFDAILEGAITDGVRVLAPAFAAGALAGVAVLSFRAPLIAAVDATRAKAPLGAVTSGRGRASALASA